jgi:chemotaxis protein MotB
VLQLEGQLEHLQETNSSLLDRMADMSIINKADAESIRGSISSLNTQFDYINKLSNEIERKDSINNMLAQNLKSSLIDINDKDVEVTVKGSAVMVSLSDKMLFGTASSTISQSAYNVLKKVAKIINDNDDIDITVEGHTDDIPIANNNYQDNWDLSVNRATSVVRLLQENFNVDPVKMRASGRAQYIPKTENSTRNGRSQNRRTEIILTPRLDQFFKLLESPDLIG